MCKTYGYGLIFVIITLQMLRLIIKHSNYVFLEFLIAKYSGVSMLIRILNENYIFFRPVESLTTYIMAHQGFILNLEGKVINISLPNNFQFTTLYILCPKPKNVFS